MPRTKINVPVQVDIKNDVDFNGKILKNIHTPVQDTDAANKAYVDAQISSGTLGMGLSEDGSYTDGLFNDFVSTMPVGWAVDRFNEVLKSLAPQPAPNFSSISMNNAGVSGKLSFGTSNVISGYTSVPGVDINGSYTASGNRKGIFSSGNTMTGTLADNVTPSYSNNRPYPNYSVGDGDKGYLHLEVNGSIVHTVDLSTFSSGTSATSGSGFTLSAIDSVKFTNGDTFTMFKYRTGTYMVAPAAQRKGYNVIRVRHEYSSGQFRDSQYIDFVVDDSTATTSYASDALSALSLTGSNKISGVNYHTGGTANYAVTISNAYKNTYSSGATPISFTGTNCSASSQAMISMTSENDSIALSNVPVTLSVSTRLLNGSISMYTSVDRTINSNEANSTAKTISGILIDKVTDTSNATTEYFDGELYRIHTGLVLTDTAYGSGGQASSYTWDSAQNLISGSATHNAGLLISNSRLTYPKNTSHITGITNGDFSSVTNGPAGNPNYSTATGNRTYLRYFYTSTAKSNFRLNLSVTNTSFVSVASGPSGNNLTLEVLAPNTTVNGSAVVTWKDAMVAHSGLDTDVGCYAGTYGSTVPTSWGCTLGAKNTSTSGGVIVVRITASENWTGSIDSITLTWL